MAQHNEFGRKGEQLATAFLSENGYTILERNYRFQKAEIDIIAIKEGILAIVEVKSRGHAPVVNPQDAITKRKIQLLTSAANAYVIANDLDVEVRFDLILILKEKGEPHITHIEHAFYHF
ncbi:MAG: YraN family protein [Bacteroidota bacterium]